MAASSAIIGNGTTLEVDDGGGYDLIAEVFDLNFPSKEVDEVEVTHYTSPDDYREFIGGFFDGAEVNISINYVKTTVDALADLVAIPVTWRITLPDLSTWVFGGHIKTLGGEIPNNDKVTTTVTVKITGAPVFTASV